MFLGILSEANKERFINLCGFAANADGSVVELEQDMIYAYCREMNIEEHMPDGKCSLADVLNEIKNDSTEQEKRVITFEIMGLFGVDDEYAPEEEELMKKILNALEIDKVFFNNMIGLFNIYKSVYKEICKTVL